MVFWPNVYDFVWEIAPTVSKKYFLQWGNVKICKQNKISALLFVRVYILQFAPYCIITRPKLAMHREEIPEIYPHTFLTKITRNQRFR